MTNGERLEQAFRSSFMKPVIEKTDYWEVETTQGTCIIPTDVHGWTAVTLDPNELADYCLGDIEDSEPLSRKEGWLARMSAPGYMDCTDWAAFETEDEAVEYLLNGWGDDDEES